MINSFSMPHAKVTVTPVGLEIAGDLSFEEWSGLASHIGQAARSVAFVIGDWLYYGQRAFQGDDTNLSAGTRIQSGSYEAALAATGLDRATLYNYAYVSRNVPSSLRSERLSWEHHRMIAKLQPAGQQAWLRRCLAEEAAGRPISSRRLRKSISLGRIATAEDMEPDPADKGITNHIPFVNRLVGWWRGMLGSRFLENATREQREALKRDLQPVVRIYEQL